jgi:hypothetical protein
VGHHGQGRQVLRRATRRATHALIIILIA